MVNDITPPLSDERASTLATLGEVLTRSCVELMAEYGLDATATNGKAAASSPVPVLVAGVDFKGRELRGTVALWAPVKVIMQTALAAPGLDARPEDMPEWTCELTNQLVGRMKNKLRPYSVALSVNVPRLLTGPDVVELDEGLRYRFSCELGPLVAYLDVLIAPGFALRSNEPAEPLSQEGDLTLF